VVEQRRRRRRRRSGDLSNQQLVTDVELEPLDPLPLPSPFNILKKKKP
jgi:hypothetical protein